MKTCPLCGEEITYSQVICEDCEELCDETPTGIEKREKEHVIDGYSWWRLSHENHKSNKKRK